MNLFKSFEVPTFTQEFKETVFNAKWCHQGKNLAISDEKGQVIVKTFKKEFFDYQQGDI